MANYEKQDTTGWDAERVRHSEEPERRRPRKRRRNPMSVVLYVAFVLVTSAILAGVGWLLANDLCAFNKPPLEVTIEISNEDNLSSVAKKLKTEGLIEYKWFFKLFGAVANAEEKIGGGSYTLNSDMDYRALIAAMENGSGNLNSATVKVTIPEGYTVAQTIALLAENKVSTVELLTQAAQTQKFDYPFIDNVNLGSASRLEGYLFPDTYEFYVGEAPESALKRLISNFNKKLDEEIKTLIQNSGHTTQEIITIASLIEKETDGNDQSRISSVIYNRMRTRGETAGLLQIDAALLYAIPSHAGVITNEDKKIDSPYNLYTHKGLPPTPIANPGLASIRAALKPETTDFYFYALGKDGVHHFFKTYREHVNFLNSGEAATA
ncbi:MAG: endolytic transglycosylase MltG [Oscillospiraceae bacterium]